MIYGLIYSSNSLTARIINMPELPNNELDEVLLEVERNLEEKGFRIKYANSVVLLQRMLPKYKIIIEAEENEIK